MNEENYVLKTEAGCAVAREIAMRALEQGNELVRQCYLLLRRIEVAEAAILLASPK